MLNKGLLELQNKKREESIERVNWAVQFIQDTEGAYGRVTAVKIASTTGLSRAALYKPHLRRLWDPVWINAQEANQVTRQSDELRQTVKKLQEEITLLQMQLKNAHNQYIKRSQELENEKTRSKVYREDYENLKEQHQKLLHYNLRLLRKLHVYGIDTSALPKEDE